MEKVDYLARARAVAEAFPHPTRTAFESGVLVGRAELLDELHAFINGLLFEAEVNADALARYPDAYLSELEAAKLAIVQQFAAWCAQKNSQLTFPEL